MSSAQDKVGPRRVPPARGGATDEPAGADTDAGLVARALSGDRWAEDALYRRHAPRITRLATRLMQRHGEADDVVQDTFVIAFARLAQLRDRTALGPWLNRIAVNLARRRLRLRSIWRALRIDRGHDDATLQLLAVEGTRPDLRAELESVDAVLRGQPTERRLAFMLHRVEGLSLSETAAASGRSVATTKRYVAAVDSELARILGERGPLSASEVEPHD